MIVQANSHLGFVCHDLDKSVKFYEDVLGCREKITRITRRSSAIPIFPL